MSFNEHIFIGLIIVIWFIAIFRNFLETKKAEKLSYECDKVISKAREEAKMLEIEKIKVKNNKIMVKLDEETVEKLNFLVENKKYLELRKNTIEPEIEQINKELKEVKEKLKQYGL